jgi:hemerythrin superfamily protein
MTMTRNTHIQSSSDVVSFLTDQHAQVKALFELVETATGSGREQAFYDLRRLLAVHETAEEQIVHPRAKREIPGGEDIVSARLDEEHEAKETLATLEKMDLSSAEFDAAFATFRTAVLAHAEAEEQQEFARLQSELDEDTLDRMRRAAEVAEKMAPTRPHAGVESATANTLVGPFAAMLDRARDAMSRPAR